MHKKKTIPVLEGKTRCRAGRLDRTPHFLAYNSRRKLDKRKYKVPCGVASRQCYACCHKTALECKCIIVKPNRASTDIATERVSERKYKIKVVSRALLWANGCALLLLKGHEGFPLFLFLGLWLGGVVISSRDKSYVWKYSDMVCTRSQQLTRHNNAAPKRNLNNSMRVTKPHVGLVTCNLAMLWQLSHGQVTMEQSTRGINVREPRNVKNE